MVAPPLIETIPENHHHVYPRSNRADGTNLLHAPSYIAALWDGALSVGALCGATTFTNLTSENRTGLTDCPDCLRWLNHLAMGAEAPRG